jgi:hypothetical protein
MNISKDGDNITKLKLLTMSNSIPKLEVHGIKRQVLRENITCLIITR